ncbi:MULTISPECIES: beta-N-acetylhexosaminidase [Streptacidiphilus]|uniref:beta-N-acetylhexosaminidase n=1 Tax=Streptacidiphilus cavernicola TaxID=3342716 RepID=A0ABV6UQ32_9ACTN|nr:beta-N-acetylhexosaminidase [Streptacidiphilus jeojiense]
MIIPRPRELTPRPGTLPVGPDLHLSAGPGAEQAAGLLAEYLGLPDAPTGPGPRLRLELVPDHPATAEQSALGPQGYLLDIRPDGATLAAPAEAGLLSGIQTLRQLLPPEALDPERPLGADGHWPCLTIRDSPRLPWRGFMLDVVRHFFPLSYLLELVDELALLKFNVLQLHLTDDQGWRFEVDGLPRLTEVGAWRTETQVGPPGSGLADNTPHGGYYTRAELQQLVAFAARRGITVVPEIEMPGHVRAALAAYPEYGNHPERRLPVWTQRGISEDILSVDDKTLAFCRQILDTVVQVFPSRHVHIGGEECPTVQWEQSEAARERARELGLAHPAQLRGWFLGRMQEHLAGHGRRTVCWDETGHAAGEPPAGMVLGAWRDPVHGVLAVGRGHQVVMGPHRSTYLDYPQRDHPHEPHGQPGEIVGLDDVLRFDPLAADLQPGGLPVADPAQDELPGVLGVQGSLWTEYVATPAHARYLLYPRLCGIAEIAWRPGPHDRESLLERAATHRRRVAALLSAGGTHTPRMIGTIEA